VCESGSAFTHAQPLMLLSGRQPIVLKTPSFATENLCGSDGLTNLNFQFIGLVSRLPFMSSMNGTGGRLSCVKRMHASKLLHIFLMIVLTIQFKCHALASCSDLARLVIPQTTIVSATLNPAGTFIRPEPPEPESALSLTTPSFCRVIGIAEPTDDSVIKFEIWMPDAGQWNGKFLGVGNGAYYGSISYGAMADALSRGFATASTDTGHSGGDLRFAVGHPQKVIDWAYRAIHVMTENAKLILRDYYGRFPRHSYFRGCSTGGEQALSEAQRFPHDYDGVLAGDPGNNRTHLNAGFLWDFMAAHSDQYSILSVAKLKLINAAAVASCDGASEPKRGFVANPESCHFDPAILLCASIEQDNCLTSAQVEAVRKIYAGPKNSRTGEQILPGYEPGSESPEGDANGGWKAYITGVSEPKRLDFWKYWVFDDPSWDWRSFDFDRDLTYADEKLSFVNAISPDLSAFSAAGGKLIAYSGWADPIGPPEDAVNYFKSVVKVSGGSEATQSFFRLFMVPGMSHCDDGPGPVPSGGAFGSNSKSVRVDADHDLVDALDRWVQQNVLPRRLIASHLKNGVIDRTGLLCPYPEIAKWKGSGSIFDAASFECRSR
jgi:feruloyl esterase